MTPRIREVAPLPDYRLSVLFDDGKRVVYDVQEDMEAVPSYRVLREVHGLFRQVRLDRSRTCVYWNEDVDLPWDAIYQYGVPVSALTADTPG